LLLGKNSFVNISRTCVFVFVFVFNNCTKSSTISTIKNMRYTLIYIDFFAINKNNNNKKEAIFFCAIALITSIIKKCKNCILNFAFREFVFFSSLKASNID